MSEENIETKSDEEISVTPLFTKNEIRDTVKGFILAFIRKEVKVNLSAGQEAKLKTLLETKGKKLSHDEEFKFAEEEIRYISNRHSSFTSLMEICSGVTPCTPEELEKSFNEFFKQILIFRSADRLEGSFVDYSIEERLVNIEKKAQTDIDFLKNEVRWLKEQLNV